MLKPRISASSPGIFKLCFKTNSNHHHHYHQSIATICQLSSSSVCSSNGRWITASTKQPIENSFIRHANFSSSVTSPLPSPEATTAESTTTSSSSSPSSSPSSSSPESPSPSSSQPNTNKSNETNRILHEYKSRIELNQLKDDPYQLDVAKQLQRLDNDLRDYHPDNTLNSGMMIQNPFTFLSKIFSSGNNGGNTLEDEDLPDPKVRGLYLHGDVGCGKTMLMDLFYDNCCVDRRHKRRIHFHSFMLEFHNRLHRYKTARKSMDTSSIASGSTLQHNPIAAIAEEITSESWLLCLDEFQVTDIGDAMILRHFFKELFIRGTIMVATSNRHPDDLYKNGIQRSTFLPFIPMLKKYCLVYQIQSDIDYRRLITASEHQVYFVKDAETNNKLDILFKVLANNENDIVRARTLTIKGRNVMFSKTCGGVLDTTFDELCDQPLGAIDYLAISQAFHTVIVRDVPKMSIKIRVQARRFITMIDTFYDHHIHTIFSGDVPWFELFSHERVEGMETSDANRMLMDDLGIQLGKDPNAKSSIFSGEEEIFAFDRTISRISEMQTPQYWNYKKKLD